MPNPALRTNPAEVEDSDNKDLLQVIDLARILPGEGFPLHRNARYMMVMVDAKDKTEKTISDAAARALAEAEARRKSTSTPQLPKEVDGRKGPEPTRFGDWEVKGIASDF